MDAPASIRLDEPITADQALSMLRAHSTDFPRCKEYLTGILHSATILEILTVRFPEELPADPSALLERNEYGLYREAELLLAQVVHHHLFPLDEWRLGLVFDDEEGEPLTTIPLPRFFDHEDDLGESFDSLYSGYRVAAALYWSSSYGVEFYHALGVTEEDLSRLRPLPSGAVDADRLKSLCAAETSPMRHLHAAVAVVSQNTGSVFFDGECTCGQCRTIEWSLEVLDWLVEQFRAADEIQDQIIELSHWLDEDFGSRFEHVVRVWNAAAKQKEIPDESTQKKRNAQRNRTHHDGEARS